MLSNKELRVLGGGPWDTSASLNEAELNGARKEQSRRVHDATECFVVLSDSADSVITGGTDGSVAAWNFKSGERIWVHESHNGEVTSLQVSGEYVVIGYYDGTVR